MYNAADTKAVRRAAREAKIASAAADVVLFNLMQSPSGRAYVYNRLAGAFVFHTPFTGDLATTSFNCGIQSTGLRDLADLMRVCPDQYIAMLREAADKDRADGRRNDSPGRDDDSGQRSNAYGDGGDSSTGGRVDSDYDPGAGLDPSEPD